MKRRSFFSVVVGAVCGLWIKPKPDAELAAWDAASEEVWEEIDKFPHTMIGTFSNGLDIFTVTVTNQETGKVEVVTYGSLTSWSS